MNIYIILYNIFIWWNFLDFSGEKERITYKKIDGSSQTQQTKLIDSVVFLCTLKRRGMWRCTFRNKNINCKATVKEDGGQFTRGVHEHVHQPDANCDIVAHVITAVRQNAENDPFESAAIIAEEAVNEAVEGGLPLPTLPSISNLSRQANHRREATRPQDPRGLDFQLQMEHIPEGFLQRDVTVGTHRHLICNTGKSHEHQYYSCTYSFNSIQ